MKRGPKKRYLLPQDEEEGIFHKWNINLKKFWLDHQQVLDEIEIGNLTYDSCDKFYNSWICIIGIYSYCSVQWALPHTWPKPAHQKMKQEILEQMEHIRKSVYPVKNDIDKVIQDTRLRSKQNVY